MVLKFMYKSVKINSCGYTLLWVFWIGTLLID